MNIRYPIYEGVYRILTLYIYTAVEAKRFPVCAANSGSPA